MMAEHRLPEQGNPVLQLENEICFLSQIPPMQKVSMHGPDEWVHMVAKLNTQLMTGTICRCSKVPSSSTDNTANGIGRDKLLNLEIIVFNQDEQQDEPEFSSSSSFQELPEPSHTKAERRGSNSTGTIGADANEVDDKREDLEVAFQQEEEESEQSSSCPEPLENAFAVNDEDAEAFLKDLGGILDDIEEDGKPTENVLHKKTNLEDPNMNGDAKDRASSSHEMTGKLSRRERKALRKQKKSSERRLRRTSTGHYQTRLRRTNSVIFACYDLAKLLLVRGIKTKRRGGF